MILEPLALTSCADALPFWDQPPESSVGHARCLAFQMKGTLSSDVSESSKDNHQSKRISSLENMLGFTSSFSSTVAAR